MIKIDIIRAPDKDFELQSSDLWDNKNDLNI